MKPAAIVKAVADQVRRRLRERPDLQVCIAFVAPNTDNSQHVDLMLPADFDRTVDTVFIAEALLRNADAAITAGRHPGCDNCRQKLKAIHAARAALGFETGERPS